MKDYSPGKWGVGFIFSLEGSVFPRALCCALPNALLSVAVWYICNHLGDEKTLEDAKSGITVGQVWTGYNWVIGFIVAFRTQRAYSRWWEGGTLLQQARGEWFNAYSSLIAFCSPSADKYFGVEKFQQVLARLMSMLYASALMSIATETDLDFEILDASGMDKNRLQYLRSQPDKCEIIMQWIQRLIVDNMGAGILPIPPPVISRVFQELSRGIVNIHNCRKITEFQFPFPAAQMIVTMLIIQWVLTPIVTALLVGSPTWAFLLSFFPIFACWGINYLAGELEQPFGTDYNDMPMHFMQASMNTSILALLDAEAQTPPEFDMAEQRLQAVIPNPRKSKGANMVISDPMRSVVWVTVAEPEQLNSLKHRFTRGRDATVGTRSANRRAVRNFASLARSSSKLPLGVGMDEADGDVDYGRFRSSKMGTMTFSSEKESIHVGRASGVSRMSGVSRNSERNSEMVEDLDIESKARMSGYLQANHHPHRSNDCASRNAHTNAILRATAAQPSEPASDHDSGTRSASKMMRPKAAHPQQIVTRPEEMLDTGPEDDISPVHCQVPRRSVSGGDGVRCPDRAPDTPVSQIYPPDTSNDADYQHNMPGTPFTSELRPKEHARERPASVW